jgi:hypothetical protein
VSDGSRIKPRTAPPPARERPREATRPPEPSPFDAPKAEKKPPAHSKKKPALQMDAAIVTVATAEPSVVIEKFWVEVDGNQPAGFDVSTRAGHGLEVTLEQRAYRKVYTGTGSLKTGLTPIAPIGTKGRIIAKDTTTGETVEQPWTWRLIRGGGLWQLIKRLLWKG